MPACLCPNALLCFFPVCFCLRRRHYVCPAHLHSLSFAIVMVVVVLLLPLMADDSSRQCGLLSDRYVYCERCFNEIKCDEVELADDPTQPPT